MSLIEKEIWSWIQLRILQLIIPQSFLGFDAFDSPWESPPPPLTLACDAGWVRWAGVWGMRCLSRPHSRGESVTSFCPLADDLLT